MARPRPVLPGKIYLATRRCACRQFLLRPGEATNQALLYCLAEAASRFPGIQVLWFLAMSNHLHYGIYDKDGSYPDFLAHFHMMASKLLNSHWGRWGSLFEDEQTSMVELADHDAVFDKMIYSLTNAVEDHLVKHAIDWPGASSLMHQLNDTELVVARPDWFFAEDTKMPEVARLRFERPLPFVGLNHKTWTDKIRKAIKARERHALKERRETGQRVLGVGPVLAQSAFAYPKGHEPRREMSPRVAARNKWRRIETIQRNTAFLIAYAAALAEHRAGHHDVVFPPGTYQLYEDGFVFRQEAA